MLNTLKLKYYTGYSKPTAKKQIYDEVTTVIKFAICRIILG
jgi:hypothetical protein